MLTYMILLIISNYQHLLYAKVLCVSIILSDSFADCKVPILNSYSICMNSCRKQVFPKDEENIILRFSLTRHPRTKCQDLTKELRLKDMWREDFSFYQQWAKSSCDSEGPVILLRWSQQANCLGLQSDNFPDASLCSLLGHAI